MGVDLNKEIKLSDLFRRKAKDASAEASEAKPSKPEKPKKERRARRKRADGDAVVSSRTAPELPAVPLMRAFNLMPREEAREKTSRLGLGQVLVALLGLLLVAGLGSGYLFMSARASDRQNEVYDLRAQLADLEVPAEAPAKPGATELVTEGESRTTALATALQGRVAWDRVLREVTLVLPDKAYLTQISATTPSAGSTTSNPAVTTNPNAAPNSLALIGYADRQASVAELMARLEVVPEFATVDLQSSTAQQGGVYAFSILATIAPEGAR